MFICLIPLSVPRAIVGVGYHALSSSRLKVNFTTPLLSITQGIVLYYEVTVREYGSDTPLFTQQVQGNGSVIEAEFTRLSESCDLYVHVM